MNHSKVPKIDLHIHSEFSPCSKDTSIQSIVSVAEAKRLEKIAITDHGKVENPRWLSTYFSEIERARKNTKIDILTGMEVNIRSDGSLTVNNNILRDLDIVIGAIHSLPILEIIRKKSIAEEYLTVLVESLERNQFDILAHPTSLLWNKHITSETADMMIQRIKKKNVAVEMNYHHKDPSFEFLQRCIQSGVTITPSSDAHRLSEIGHYEWFEDQISKINEPIRWIQI